MYDQIIDPATWATMSEMTLGSAYRLVQNTIPNLTLNVLWASETSFDLMPEGAALDEVNVDLARKVRDFTVYQLRDQMKIESKGYPTILDGVKVGNGYGIIEPKVIYSAERAKTTIQAEGKKVEAYGLELEEPRTVASYRPLTFGSVIPTPDGATPEEVTAVNVVDAIDEWTFRDLYADKDGPMEGNPEEIIKYVKQAGFDASTYTIRSLIAKIIGLRDMPEIRYPNRRKNKGPVMIPIVKQFRKDAHVWIVADRFRIYKKKRSVGTLQCPVINYKFAPENGVWFTRGVINPNLDLMRTIEMWSNAMLDLFSLHLHPHQIVNIDACQEEDAAEDLQPYGKTFVRGEPSRAMAFQTPPTLPPTVAGIGDHLQRVSDDLAGLNAPQGGQLSPGIVRGGSSALETLLASSTNREKVSVQHLIESWYKPLIELTLIYSSIFAQDNQEFAIVKTAEKTKKVGKASLAAGSKYFDVIKITRDDLAHVWRVSINFRERLRNVLAESSHRLQVYDRLKENPGVNPDELLRYLIGDDYQVANLLAGVDKQGRVEELSELVKRGLAGQGRPVMPATAPGGVLGGGGTGLGSVASGIPGMGVA
jgi:hypothetical protein